MNESTSHKPEPEDLAFFGGIVAGATHEMRNILSTIGEYAGLADDLLAASGPGRPPDGERLKNIAGRIARQVERGTVKMEQLSRFAHATDEPSVRCDLARIVRNACALIEREVLHAGGTLGLELPEKRISVEMPAFRLQHALAMAVRLAAGSGAGRVEVRLRRAGDCAALSVSAASPVEEGSTEGLERISALAGAAGWGVQTPEPGKPFSLVVKLPAG